MAMNLSSTGLESNPSWAPQRTNIKIRGKQGTLKSRIHENRRLIFCSLKSAPPSSSSSLGVAAQAGEASSRSSPLGPVAAVRGCQGGCEGKGKLIDILAKQFDIVARYQVEYEVLPGWQTDISSIGGYSDLPKAARQFMDRIEELVSVPINYIGVGPGRDSLIFK